MRIVSALGLVGLVVLPFLTSCSGLRSGNTAVKASFEANENDGWMTRKIPGMKTLSDLIPPPNEARMKWDQRNRRQSDLTGTDSPAL
ncbi:MAG: hypothetical protein WCG29_00240 [Desulfomonile sp.]|jgi:hypothetical protein|nr:hypothetical protein [Deltaproteobacteria bacterium]